MPSVLVPVGLALALAAAPSAAPANDFKKGEELFAQYKYPEARAAMARARAVKGLTRAMLLRILEVQGVSAAQQRQAAATEAAFKELLYLAPEHQLETEYAPRVMTPFFEARRQVGEAGGSLELRARAAETSRDRVEKLGVTVKDPLAIGKSVRFHVKGGTDAWAVSSVPVVSGGASIPAAFAEVSWWAELVGDNETQLALVGSEGAPLQERPPPPVALVPEPPPSPPPQVEAVGPVVEKSSSPLRPISYVVLGGAAVAGGLGAWFGLQSSSAFAEIDRATRDGSGRVTSLTEKRAFELSASGKQNGLIGNALFIGAGGLGVAAVVMWLVGSPGSSDAVSIVPTPSGVMVSGSLP